MRSTSDVSHGETSQVAAGSPSDDHHNSIAIYSNRLKLVGMALFLGWFGVAIIVREIAAHDVGGIVFFVVAFGGPCAWAILSAARRRPALVIDGHALTDGASGRVVPWTSVAVALVDVHQGLFGESHSLVLRLEHESEAPRRFIMTNATNPDVVLVLAQCGSGDERRSDRLRRLLMRASGAGERPRAIS